MRIKLYTLHLNATEEIKIWYGIYYSPFGWCLIGVIQKKICNLLFLKNNKNDEAIKILIKLWPNTKIIRNNNYIKPYKDKIFDFSKTKKSFSLLPRGTNFQLKVWRTLLKIPRGKTITYKEIAKIIVSPKAYRAVGSACNKNPIGFIIPCHRVIASKGKLGNYKWGILKKDTILKWESRKIKSPTNF